MGMGKTPWSPLVSNMVPSLGVLLVSVAVSLVSFLATARFSPNGLKERTGSPKMMLFWLLFIQSPWRILAWVTPCSFRDRGQADTGICSSHRTAWDKGFPDR